MFSFIEKLFQRYFNIKSHLNALYFFIENFLNKKLFPSNKFEKLHVLCLTIHIFYKKS